jgi:hypothetical protein
LHHTAHFDAQTGFGAAEEARKDHDDLKHGRERIRELAPRAFSVVNLRWPQRKMIRFISPFFSRRANAWERCKALWLFLDPPTP